MAVNDSKKKVDAVEPADLKPSQSTSQAAEGDRNTVEHAEQVQGDDLPGVKRVPDEGENQEVA